MSSSILCPSCRNAMNVRSFILQATIRCPACAHVFNYTSSETTLVPAATPPEPEADTQTPREKYSSRSQFPHVCSRCGAREPVPARLNRITSQCSACHDLTSTNVVEFPCAFCVERIVVSTEAVGSQSDCPACGRTQVVPSWKPHPGLKPGKPITTRRAAEHWLPPPVSQPIVEPEPPPESPREVRPFQLALPHHCVQCKGLIAAPTGQCRSTCNCPACGQRTSIYAVLFLCPHCCARLESPANSASKHTDCPACNTDLIIPRDMLRTERPFIDEEDHWFLFDCPSCNGLLYTSKEDVDALAVCPHCLVTLTVPRSGRYIDDSSPRDHYDIEQQCPVCKVHLPVACVRCPCCGSGLPFDPDATRRMA